MEVLPLLQFLLIAVAAADVVVAAAAERQSACRREATANLLVMNQEDNPLQYHFGLGDPLAASDCRSLSLAMNARSGSGTRSMHFLCVSRLPTRREDDPAFLFEEIAKLKLSLKA